MKILLILLLGFTSLMVSAQSTNRWTLSERTTGAMEKIFSHGPKDSVPDTLFTDKKDIVIYDIASEKINFMTRYGSVVETDLEGKVLYASKKDFVYYFKEGKEIASDGNKILNEEEILDYMLPIIMELEIIL